MHIFTKFQLKIIERLLEQDILDTSALIKIFIENKEIGSSWAYQSVKKLEELQLIEKIKNQRTGIKHKKLFDKKMLENKYNLIFFN